MRFLPLLLVALMLMGQDDCEPEPPGPTKIFCQGSAGSVLLDDVNKLIDSALAAIKHGTPSVDRRGTVKINFDGYSCSGTIIGAHTVATAAHCGWTSDEHRISLEQGGPVIATSTEKLYHPDYPKYEANGDLVAREADVMLLYTDDVLPPTETGATGQPTYVQIYQHELESKHCDDLIAQGFGQAEDPIEYPCPDGKAVCLREARYTVNAVDTGYMVPTGRLLRTGEFNPGKICFGDSGGPLYALTPNGPKLAGITSTTASADCEVHSHHVHAGNTEIKQWIMSNTR